MSNQAKFQCLECNFSGILGDEDISKHRLTGCRGITSPIIERALAKDCMHPSHQITAQIDYMEDSKAWMAEMRVTCTACGTPFEFVGVSAGMRFDKPMCSVDAQELRIPIKPKGSKIMPGIVGFEVRAN